jgi:hypothetical protein
MNRALLSALRVVARKVPEGWPAPDKKGGHVYRIENKDGEGPFKNKADRAKWQLSGGDWVIPMDDLGFDSETQDWLKQIWSDGTATGILFGFEDEAQYEEYFTEDERQRLLHIGFKLNKTPASLIWVGDHQVFYLP